MNNSMSREGQRAPAIDNTLTDWEPHPTVDNPLPKLPRNPVLSAAAFYNRGDADIGSILNARSVLAVNAARTALALALKILHIGPGDAVLVPAYHCRSMVEPIAWVGAEPIYYRINWDTSADLDDLKQKLGGSARAVIAVHYFGFPTNMKEVGELCKARGVALIEDCAHCFFGEVGAQHIGSIGTYAIASAGKFFPVADGGFLAAMDRDLSTVNLRSPGIVASVRALDVMLDRATASGRLQFLKPLIWSGNTIRKVLCGAARRKAKKSSLSSLPADEYADGANDSFDPSVVDLRMSLTSRLIVRHASKREIVERRRENYLRLLEGLSAIPGCTPLFRDLPRGVVPYIFPVLFDDVKYAYPALAREAIPITHFAKYLHPGVSPVTCPVTTTYSRRLLQFSCHQDVTGPELDWMIARIRSVMTSLAA